MFRGSHAINLDAKGRLAVPTRYRERLAVDAEGLLVSTIDPETRCLLLYPLPEWERIETQLEALPSFNPVARRIQRLLIGHAADLELDGQGRILLPSVLRDYAGLTKKIMLVGQGKKFEIWDTTLWQNECEQWLSEASQQGGPLPDVVEELAL